MPVVILSMIVTLTRADQFSEYQTMTVIRA